MKFRNINSIDFHLSFHGISNSMSHKDFYYISSNICHVCFDNGRCSDKSDIENNACEINNILNNYEQYIGLFPRQKELLERIKISIIEYKLVDK